jgi:hypothetical protein
MRPAGSLRVAILACGLLALGGCQSAQDADVASSANAFYTAVADLDGTRACTWFAATTRTELEDSSGKPCDQAVLEENLTAPSGPAVVETYGFMAQIRYVDETTFLTRFPGGWRVLAVGCVPAQSSGYDCQVKGG